MNVGEMGCCVEVRGCCVACTYALSHCLHQCQRLGSGLKKILEASEQLAVLNEKLEIQKVAVTEKSEACEALLADITVKTTEANEKKELAEAKGVEIEQQNVVIAKEKVNTQTDALSCTHTNSRPSLGRQCVILTTACPCSCVLLLVCFVCL